MHPIRCLLIAVWLIPVLASRAFAADLPRQPFMGLRVGALTDSVKAASGYTGEGGVLIIEAVPKGSAAAKKVDSGLVLELNGKPVASPAAFVGEIRKMRAGQTARLVLWKNKKKQTVNVPLLPFPKMGNPEYEVVYDVVEGETARFRTIFTHPKGEGPFPTLFIVQGLGCFSMEGQVPGQGLYNTFVDEITQGGYAVVMVDKPGMGDSEGGPCPDVDFHGEVAAYRATLASLKKYPFIKQDEIFLLGHSMGGIMAPLLAADARLKGIVVYGTGVKNWMEYEMENNRKQLLLSGEDPAQVEEEMRGLRTFLTEIYVAEKPLDDVIASHPEFKDDFPNPPYMHAGKHYRYFQEINRLNLPREWQKVDVDVLALWGAADFVSYPDEHESIAEIVNGKHPGRAVYRVLPETDHWFNKADSRAASMQQGPFGGSYNAALSDTLLSWMDGVRATGARP